MPKEHVGDLVRCWPWAHDWTEWVRRREVVDSVYPHADGQARKVTNIYHHRHCRLCDATQSYLYDCHVVEVGGAHAAA
jgi:hypothetical protein